MKTNRNLEDYYTNRPVESKNKKKWWHVAAIYFGLTASLSAFTTAGSYITGLTLSQALLSNFLSFFILVLVFFLPMGIIGAREGVNTYNIGEKPFGKTGSKILTALIVTAIPSMGWYGIQVSVASDALQLSLGIDQKYSAIVMLIIGIIFVIPAMYGVTSMAWLDFISIPIIVFIILFGFIKALTIGSLDGLFSYVPSDPKTILWSINLSIGGMIIGTTFLPDYTRWMKGDKKETLYAGIIGLSPELVLVSIGLIMALTATTLGVDQPWNVALVLGALGLPTVAMFLVIILQWTTNITAAYSTGLALQKVFGGSRFWLTFLSGLIGTLLSIFGIIDHFIDFIILLAIFVSPIAGVIISDYFFVKKEHPTITSYNWSGIVSVIIGSIFAYFFPYFIEAINGLVLAGGIYYVYHTFISKGEKYTHE